MFLLASASTFFSDRPDWTIAGLVVLLGLFVYGFGDLVHFSLGRAWAISGVCFRESLRRRVLWIIPLTIVGVIIVAQLQHPTDEQDAIRQTTKFCLFATGLVVTITAIILACTSLPREIESRVIFTIVTKPITRLEIVLGKVIGFARVSATILLLMGAFTYGYMKLRAWRLDASITQRLKDNTADAATTATLNHYHDAGLLNSSTYASPNSLQIYARRPMSGDKHRWMFGGEGSFIVPFNISREQLIPPNIPAAVTANNGNQTIGAAGVYIVARMGYDRASFDAYEAGIAKAATPELPNTVSAPAPASRPAATAVDAAAMPSVSIDLLDENQNTLLDAHDINGGKPIPLHDPNGRDLLLAYIAPAQADLLLKTEPIYVRIRGVEPKVEFFAGPEPVELAVPAYTGDATTAPPLTAAASRIPPVPDPSQASGFTAPSFSTNMGTYGVQLRGGKSNVPLAIYEFHDVATHPDARGQVPMELRVGLERNGDEDTTTDDPTVVRISVVNDRRPDGVDAVTTALPEIGRTCFFGIPAAAVAGGNFKVILQCMNADEFLGVQPESLNLVVSEHTFIANLFKSLLVLWLMSFLVVIVAIFCSTFLSWPIATVLTVLILLSRWAVEQLGDATAPGIGNMFATSMGLRDPSQMRVVSDSVEALTRLLNLLAKVLPDISKFSALEDIERGISLPMARLSDAVSVILVFGLPLLVVAYVFLRRKEVAP